MNSDIMSEMPHDTPTKSLSAQNLHFLIYFDKSFHMMHDIPFIARIDNFLSLLTENMKEP